MKHIDDVAPIPEPFIDVVRSHLRGDTSPHSWPPADGPAMQLFLQAVEDHGIGPLLHRAAHASGAWAGWPSQVQERLSSVVAAGAAFELLRQNDLLFLLQELSAAGVQPLLIKGGALAFTHYESPELRPRADTDLLIRESDFPAVHSVLTRLGYGTSFAPGRDLVFSQAGFRRGSHVYDIHWRVSNRHVLRDVLCWDESVREAVTLDVLSPLARAVFPVHALMIACVHRVAHHGRTERLLWLADIFRLASRMTPGELDSFWREAGRKRIVTLCSDAFAAAQLWFGPLPGDVNSRSAEDEASRVLLGGEVTRLHLLASDLRALRGWRERFRMLRQLILPSAAAMGVRGIALPGAHLRRIVRGVGAWMR